MALDVSHSLNDRERRALLDFTRNVINALDIGLNKTLVGIIFFARDANYNFTLNQYTNKTQLLQAVDDIAMNYPEVKRTRFIPVYNLINETAFNASLGFRANFANVGIILTDGHSSRHENQNELKDHAERFNDECILDELFAVGFTDSTNKAELQLLTGDPTTAFQSTMLSGPTIDNIQQNIIQRLCQETSKCNKLCMTIIKQITELLYEFVTIHHIFALFGSLVITK